MAAPSDWILFIKENQIMDLATSDSAKGAFINSSSHITSNREHKQGVSHFRGRVVAPLVSSPRELIAPALSAHPLSYVLPH
ncbi:hypothetical protein ACE6H2_020257 [Prunus campanulata]